MKTVIRQIVDELQTGWVFDAHFVISQLIKHHSDVYIHFATPNQTTAQMHVLIGRFKIEERVLVS